MEEGNVGILVRWLCPTVSHTPGGQGEFLELFFGRRYTEVWRLTANNPPTLIVEGLPPFWKPSARPCQVTSLPSGVVCSRVTSFIRVLLWCASFSSSANLLNFSLEVPSYGSGSSPGRWTQAHSSPSGPSTTSAPLSLKSEPSHASG